MANPTLKKPNLDTELTKREAILRAAQRMFLERGYRGTSMELVATESGCGRQTVYNQFESKKALFDATVALLWNNLSVEKIIARAGTAHPSEDVLLEIGNAIADLWITEESVAFGRMIIAESLYFPELAETFHKMGRLPARRAIVKYLITLGETGRFDFPDPELAAAQFAGLINEPLLWPRVLREAKASSKKRRTYAVAEAVETFLCRYRAKKKARR
jgi:AcrR family transcriptional regulator